VRADGTVAVDGAQVDDAQLKLKADEAKALNADVSAILQVEQGAKPELVQHVTDLVKGEGIVSLISHPTESPATAPPPSKAAPPAPAAPPSSPIAPQL
jgi:biopolymer transport protein ExbD